MTRITRHRMRLHAARRGERERAMDGSVATTWRRDVPCFRCAGVAAVLLVDYESAGRGITLTLSGFLARKASFLSEPAAEAVAEVDDLDLLRWLPPTFRGFFCGECGAAYCRSCWDVGPSQHDDDGYVGTWGVCPGGHEAVVDR